MVRQRFVVDPAWKRVDNEAYLTAWEQLLNEARGCTFVGLDLEWTSRTYPITEEEDNTNGDNNEGGGEDDDDDDDQELRKKTTIRSIRTVGPVAVVQLSTFSVTFVIKLCDLIRIKDSDDFIYDQNNDIDKNILSKRVSVSSTLSLIEDNLRSLLSDKYITKVGVGIFGDQVKLQRDYIGFRLSPCVDLAVLAYRLCSSREDVLKLRSLKALASQFAGITLEKDILVTCSDWGGRLGSLSPLQLEYAAADAEASFDIAVGIFVESQEVASEEELRDACRLQKPLKIVSSILHGISGVKPTSKKTQQEKVVKDNSGVLPFKGRAKPYYDNIFVYDNEMNLVFTVDKSKAEWYVYKKGIAKVIEWRNINNDDKAIGGIESNKEIAAIQLNFSPDFAKFNDSHIRRNLDYFRQPKENQCVVCGNEKDLVRFAVVPLAYRKYLPSVYMSHNSYDLLLLCTECFAIVRLIYDTERQRISEDFGIPLKHLTPKEVKLHRKRLLQQKQQIIKSTNTSISSINENNEKECLSLSQKMSLMQEYLEIEEHREILLNIFKYAKALRAAYEFSNMENKDKYYKETEEEVKKEINENRTLINKKKREKLTIIPPERIEELSAYIRLHAPKYPFAKDTREQITLFNFDAASLKSIQCILEEGKSARTVLTRYWMREHPEIRNLFSYTTRKSEHCEKDILININGNEDMKEDSFSVDSHGFLIIQGVLQKYDRHPSKSQDHAVGEFIYRWRKTFVKGMQPKHLPIGWTPEDGILI